jgi:porphobilinogen synthase
MDLLNRPRRLRLSNSIRNLIAETQLNSSDFLMPVFVKEGISKPEPITSLSGIFRYDLKSIVSYCKQLKKYGIQGCLLFAAINEDKKNSQATEAVNPSGFYCDVIKAIKDDVDDFVVMTDVALDPFSSDGHDGLVVNGEIVNDATVEILAQMSVLHAKMGADFVAPSDMMDGRVGAIRVALDAAGFTDTGIMSYAAKFASNFYGPFRDALDSAPKEGDKKTYQMDFRNRDEAIKEAQLDESEGADILMVKPASLYLDVISDVKAATNLPIAAYHVSGEYAMLKVASDINILNYKQALTETLIAIKRAGADIIVSYGALDYLNL